MPTLTNISGVPRALPLISKRYVEFAKGETKDFPDADWAAIKSRASVAGDFRVEGRAQVAQPDPTITPAMIDLSSKFADGTIVAAPKPAKAKKA
jgi:hypothetical protein